jgi:hypothetical protein
LQEKERELMRKRQICILALKALLGVNIVWQLANIVAAIIKINGGETMEELTEDGFFLVMRISGDLATVCFLVTGIVLRAKVKALPRTTTYENEVAVK